MGRPPKHRRIASRPGVTYFKPRGVPMRDLEEVVLGLEGYEALRLVDLEGLSHESAAERMAVSRQTFGRVLTAARQTTARAIVRGAALRIEGGHAVVRPTNGENTMKRLAVSSTGPDLDAAVDPRFGRAAWFVVVDAATLAFEPLGNDTARNLGHGAGIAAVQRVASAGADVVLTGRLGPKAAEALEAAGIASSLGFEGGLSVREAVARFLAESGSSAETAPDVPNAADHGAPDTPHAAAEAAPDAAEPEIAG